MPWWRVRLQSGRLAVRSRYPSHGIIILPGFIFSPAVVDRLCTHTSPPYVEESLGERCLYIIVHNMGFSEG